MRGRHAVQSRRQLLFGLGASLAGTQLLPCLPSSLALEDERGRFVTRRVPALGTRVSFLARHPDRRHAAQAIGKAVQAVFELARARAVHAHAGSIIGAGRERADDEDAHCAEHH